MGERTIAIRKSEGAFTKPRIGVIARRYEPRAMLARGGMGEVILAYDRRLERQVAIKRLRGQAGEAGRRSDLLLAEARRLAGLQHPNIVTVHDVVKHRGEIVLVMEYLDGSTLEAHETPLGVRDFIEVARECLDALCAAHALGLIHLDIKSTNIMLARLASGRRQVKLLDFGLAALADRPRRPDAPGAVLASVYTVAPEQLEQKTPDARTDLYALGCVLYHALARREPFQGVSVEGVIDAHLRHCFRPLFERRPDLPLSLCSWVERLMARYPADRPSSAGAALAGLFALAPLWETFSPEVAPEAGRFEIAASDEERLQSAIGLPVTVRGVVDRVWENADGSLVFLNFVGVEHRDFSAVILQDPGEGTFSRRALDGLGGREVAVTGTLSAFHGSPQIVVAAAEQIRALEPGRDGGD